MTEHINIKSRTKTEDELFRLFKAAMKKKNISITNAFITSMVFMVEFYEKAETRPEFKICPEVGEVFEKYRTFKDVNKTKNYKVNQL